MMPRSKILPLLLFLYLLTTIVVTISAKKDEPDLDTNEIEGDEEEDSKNGKSGFKKDLKKDMKYLKLQYDEMFQEMKNQNHAILKQADHSRILSLKVVNMSAELATLARENIILRERVELYEFKLGKRLKKLKAKSGAMSTRLDLCKCPSFDPPPDPEDSYNPYDSPYEINSKKNKKGRKNHKAGRGGRNKKRNNHKKNNNNKNRNKDYGYASGNINYGPDENFSYGPSNGYNSNNNNRQDPYSSSDSYGTIVNSLNNGGSLDRSGGISGIQKTLSSSSSSSSSPYDTYSGYPKLSSSDSDRQDPFDAYKPRGSSKVFLTTGSSNSSELLDLDDRSSVLTSNCHYEMARYPLMVQGAVGTLIQGKPMVCGGRTSIENYYNSCYKYIAEKNEWQKAQPMMERRFQATAVMIDSQRWWVTGGFSGQYVYNETEVYEPGMGFSKGPKLPANTFQHCLVKVNATHVFTVGGYPYNRNAWLLDFDNDQWSVQKPTSKLRDAPHCAMIQRNNGKVEVVVAGGSLPGSELSTEIFSVTDNRWRTGPNLPQAIIYGVSVQFANTLVILGGHQMGGEMEDMDTIFMYDPEKELWKKKDKRLAVPRKSFVAITMPEFFKCSAKIKGKKRLYQ